MHNSSTIGKRQSRYCDDLRRPKKGRPRGCFNYLPTPPQVSQEPLVHMAVVPSHFSWFGRELPFMPVSKDLEISLKTHDEG